MSGYRTHTCGELRLTDAEKDVRLSGLGPSPARPWRPEIHRSQRPLRHHPDRGGPRFAGLRNRRDVAFGMGGPGCRSVPTPARGHRKPRAPDRSDRDFCLGDSRAVGSGRAAAAGVRRPGISRRHPSALPFPRPSPRAPAPQHHSPRGDHRQPAAAHEGARVLRIPDADSHRIDAPKAPATSWCRAGFTRENSTPCRRRRSSSSS